MAGKEWKRVLTDVKAGVWVESLRLTPEKTGFGKSAKWSIVKRVLHGGLAEGVDVIEVDNGAFAFTIVPTRGMGLWKGRYRECDVGWRAPIAGPVNPQFVNVTDAGGLGWLQGFDECIVRCGLNSNGAPGIDTVPDNNGNPTDIRLPLHGRIANAPAHQVEVSVRETENGVELEVAGVVDEGMLFFPCLRLRTRVTTLVGSNRVTIHDEVENQGDATCEMQLLYHCNFGAPFLEEGSRLVAPSRRVAPRDARAVEGVRGYHRYLGPTPGYVEQVYWHELVADRRGNTVTLLRNRVGDRGVAIRFNLRQLPCFAQWKNTGGMKDGYVTGLEPATNLPNPKRFEREKGRVVPLAPGARYPVELVVEIHDGRKGVAAVESEIATLQGKTPVKVMPQPIPRWSMAP